MWFGGHLGFHGNSTLAITCLCLPTAHSNVHGQVLWWPSHAGALVAMWVMQFGGHLGFCGNSTLAITCLCLPAAHANVHGQVVWWPPMHRCVRHHVGCAVWQPSWILLLLNIGLNLLALAHSMFKFIWSSGLVAPHMQVHQLLCRSHSLVSQCWP